MVTKADILPDPQHKIVVMSDLFWDDHLRYLKAKDVASFSLELLDQPDYYCIRKYAALILHEAPTLVLFAGDLTGDGSCGHGYHCAFQMLLLVLESQAIPSYFIAGNHDEETYYSEVTSFAENLDYAHPLDDDLATHDGLRILGLPYATTQHKRKLRRALATHTQPFDILLAHAPLKRRTWLFDFDCQMILTGHFDQKLTAIDGRPFLSLNNNWRNDFTFATIAIDHTGQASFNFQFMLGQHLIRFEESQQNLVDMKVSPQYYIDQHPVAVNGDLLPLTSGKMLDLSDFRGAVLRYGIELLRQAKANGQTLTPAQAAQLTQSYVYEDFPFSKSMIRDYLG